MESAREAGRLLLLFGMILAGVGAFLFFSHDRLPFRLGRLPGDIVYRRGQTTFYLPIGTCLVLSVAVSLLLRLFSYFRR